MKIRKYVLVILTATIITGICLSTASLCAANEAPQAGMVLPSLGSSDYGDEAILTAVYSDSDGCNDIQEAYIRIGKSSSACAWYHRPTNRIYLGTGKKRQYAQYGESKILETSRLLLDCSKTVITDAGDTLTIKWPLTFKKSIKKGNKYVYLLTKDAEERKYKWHKAGKWHVGFSRIHLKVSSGSEEGDYIGMYFERKYKEFFHEYGYGFGRGINIAVLHNVTGRIEDVQNFDNWYSGSAANMAMAKFLDDVPEGRIIMAGTCDEGSNIWENVYQQFEFCGSQYVRDLGFRDGWGLIAKKGASLPFAEAHSVFGNGGYGPCKAKAKVPLEYSFDKNPPAGSFLINGGAAATDNSEVQLDLSGITDVESDMDNKARMCFSNNGDTWSKPEKFQPVKKWYLDRGDGNKKVYAKFADASGNWSKKITAAILLQEDAACQKVSKLRNFRMDVARDDNGNIYAVCTGHKKSDYKSLVYALRSNDSGKTWSKLKNIFKNESSKECYDAAICADNNGHVYATWSAQNNYNHKQVYLNISNDYGKSWKSRPIKLSKNTPSRVYSRYPKIACDDDGNVYAMWCTYSLDDWRTCPEKILLNCSNDFGQTWMSEDIEVAEFSESAYVYLDDRQQTFDIICGNNGTAYIAWVNEDLYINHTEDGGRGWQESGIKVNQTKDIYSSSCAIRTGLDNSDNLYLAWCSMGSIYFQRTNDKGLTWLDSDRYLSHMQSSYYGNSPFSMKNDNNGNVYIAFLVNENGQSYPIEKGEIYFKASSDYGLTWWPGHGEEIRIATAAPEITYTSAPSLNCDETGGVYIGWLDRRNYILNNNRLLGYGYCGKDAYLNYSKDYGRTWLENDIRLDITYHEKDRDYWSYYYDWLPQLRVTCDKATGELSTLWNTEGVLYSDTR